MRSPFLRTIKPKAAHRSGAATIEMALVMPIFCMFILAIVEFGRGFMVVQLLNDAAREGARSAILAGSTNAAITTDAKTFMVDTVKCLAADVTVTITITEAPGNPATSNTLANARKRDLCKVKVSVPFSKVSFLPGSYLKSRTLVGMSAMRHE
jgi:Flp pilus assembly protein TadG